MPNRYILLILTSLFSCQTGVAAPPVWAKEPAQVLGIALGAPASDQIPDCPAREYGQLKSPEKFCKRTKSLDRDGRGYVDFEAIPMGEILSTITAYTYDGDVGSVHAIAPHSSYNQLRAAMIERYGSPSSVSTTTVRTNAGVEWPSEELEWTGKAVSIQLHERFDRVTSSAMIASHVPTLAKHADREEAQAKKAASQL